jgi:hypothetical protein
MKISTAHPAMSPYVGTTWRGGAGTKRKREESYRRGHKGRRGLVIIRQRGLALLGVLCAAILEGFRSLHKFSKGTQPPSLLSPAVIAEEQSLDYANKESAGMARCLRNDRIISTVSFLFLLRTSDTRLRPPRILVRSDGLSLGCPTLLSLAVFAPRANFLVRRS